jgi:ABC-type multidrug transport system ATPase subunit
MKLIKPIFLSVSLLLFLPNPAFAEDIEVRAGNVRVRTSEDGNINIETRKTHIYVPESPSFFEFLSPNRYLNTRQRSSCRGDRRISRQETTQITNNGEIFVETNTNICR